MHGKGDRFTLMWSIIGASCAAAVVAFLALYRLRDDPLPSLGATFRLAAFLQPIPFAGASALAICLRRRPEILRFSLTAVIACGTFGWWWLSGLAEVRQIENEPVRRQAVGNILPDIEGQAGSIEALVWPIAVIVIIVGITLVGWATSRRTKRVLNRGNRPKESES